MTTPAPDSAALPTEVREAVDALCEQAERLGQAKARYPRSGALIDAALASLLLGVVERQQQQTDLGKTEKNQQQEPEPSRDAMVRLARFGAWAIRELRDDNLGADLDGGDAQDEALRLGVLVTVRMSEPCGEGCACLEYDGDFPTDCYRFPAEITQSLRTLMLTEEAPVPAVDFSRSSPDALTPTLTEPSRHAAR